MRRILPFLAAFAIAVPMSSASSTPAFADGNLAEDIVSPRAESNEDCEAMRESLEARRDDNVLNAQDMQELRNAGC